MKEIDVGVEADLLDDIAKSIIPKGFEEGFKKSDKLGDMPRALEDIRKSRDPRVGKFRIRRESRQQTGGRVVWENVPKGLRVKEFFPIGLVSLFNSRLCLGVCVKGKEGICRASGMVKGDSVDWK